MTILQHSYLGRKGGAGVAEWIINKMPKHDVYIECFLGHGVVFYKKKPAQINIGIEKDCELRRSHTDKYIYSTCNIDKNNCNGHIGTSQLKQSMVDNSQISHRYFFDDVFVQLPTLLKLSMCAGKVICVYLDPPYLHDTRSDYDGSQYTHELTVEDHIKLLSMLEQFKSEKVFFILSGYKSDLYMSMLQDWKYFEMQTISRGGVRTESLWASFNPDEYIKHDYSYVGSDFTDRQRIKRKIER